MHEVNFGRGKLNSFMQNAAERKELNRLSCNLHMHCRRDWPTSFHWPFVNKVSHCHKRASVHFFLANLCKINFEKCRENLKNASEMIEGNFERNVMILNNFWEFFLPNRFLTSKSPYVVMLLGGLKGVCWRQKIIVAELGLGLVKQDIQEVYPGVKWTLFKF